jgi:hypothetical protein
VGDLVDPNYQEQLPREPVREVNLAGPDPSIDLNALVGQFLAQEGAAQQALLAQQRAALLAQQQAALLGQQQQLQQPPQLPPQLQLKVAQQRQALLALQRAGQQM